MTASFLFQDPSKIPSWLKINKIYYPDFIVPDPKVSALRCGVLQATRLACKFSSATEKPSQPRGGALDYSAK